MSAPSRTTCRSCNEPIIWVVTEQGKRMPLDVEPTETGTVALREQTPGVGRVVSRNGRYPGQKLYVSHFATCRFSQAHRKPVAPRPITPSAMPQDGLFSEVPR
jgi:hypothetical protein